MLNKNTNMIKINTEIINVIIKLFSGLLLFIVPGVYFVALLTFFVHSISFCSFI